MYHGMRGQIFMKLCPACSGRKHKLLLVRTTNKSDGGCLMAKALIRRTFWLLLILGTTVAPVTAAQSAPTAAEALARVRAAVGYERLRARRNGVLAKGTARVGGLDSKLTLLFAPDGRFRTDIEGPLGSVTGFDGTAGWELDWSGMPRPLELEDLELAQLEAAVRSARWLADDGPFAVSVDAAKTDDEQVAFNLALKKGLLNATVFVDRATWLPKTV